MGENINEEIQMLDDIYYATLVVNEESRGKRPGVLSTVEGPFMDINDENRNTRVYSRSLIENKIIKLPYTQEMMKYKTLLGEGRHPKDRYEIWATEASHSITDLWISDDGKQLMGRADILDTPTGRVIQTLVDYGSTMGISARATGKVIKKDGKFYVDEETYNFKTFDFVTNPGFESARLVPVNESNEDYLESIYSSMRNLIEREDTDSGTLRAIKSILESSEGEVQRDLIGMIESRLVEESDDVESDLLDTIDEMNEDRVNLEEENFRLRLELKEARNQLMARESREYRIINESKQNQDSMGKLLKRKSKIISELMEESEYLSSQVKTLTEQVETYSHENEVLEELVVSLDDANKSLNEDIESLRTNFKSTKISEGKSTLGRSERMKMPMLESLVDNPVSATLEVTNNDENKRLSRMLAKQ